MNANAIVIDYGSVYLSCSTSLECMLHIATFVSMSYTNTPSTYPYMKSNETNFNSRKEIRTCIANASDTKHNTIEYKLVTMNTYIGAASSC